MASRAGRGNPRRRHVFRAVMIPEPTAPSSGRARRPGSAVPTYGHETRLIVHFARASARGNPLQCRPMSSPEAAAHDAGVSPGATAVASDDAASAAPNAAARDEAALDAGGSDVAASDPAFDVALASTVVAHGALDTDDANEKENEADALLYASLSELDDFTDAVDVARHTLAPGSMLLAQTRVLGVPGAIDAGRYRDVNALGVATIVALSNAMRELELPFLFEGDGATLLVPGSHRAPAERALRAVRDLARTAFELELRASIIPLAELRAAGHELRLGRFRASEHVPLAVFSGGALAAADAWLREPERAARHEVGEGESLADFAGFECRWQPQGSQRGHTVSLIVRALAPTLAERTQTYRNLLNAFERIVDTSACHPITPGQLQLEGWLGDYSVEARVRAQGASGPSYAAARRNARKQTLVGKLLAASGIGSAGFDGRRYKRELVDNCDYRRFGDGLRLVVDLNVAEIYRLESRLAAEHRAGRLAYGLHRSSAARLTCLVRSYDGAHVHFVDGADGGFALAARDLRAQLEALAARGGKGPEARPLRAALKPLEPGREPA